MGIGESIEKAAENAMEDLAGTSRPTDDGRVPEPGESDDDIQVHSSISEGSNAMENPAEDSSGEQHRHDTAPVSGNSDSGGSGMPSDTGAAAPHVEDTPDVPRDVPGKAGLPSSAPDGLRADPSEADEDPSTSMGRG
ncbi:MAG: hypothetical protein JWO29_1165 [Arthrobacter sp.]|nr:hypothetical protein [Arthrobacter sp.]